MGLDVVTEHQTLVKAVKCVPGDEEALSQCVEALQEVYLKFIGCKQRAKCAATVAWTHLMQDSSVLRWKSRNEGAAQEVAEEKM